VRFITSQLVQLGKTLQIPIILVGHVTKEGSVAGPMTLSHMVDTVLSRVGESVSGTRILRCHKNRFGDTTEVGIFVMDEKGLVELSDASSFFIDKSNKKIPGACFTVILEGTRPLVLEIQALTVPTGLSFPRRTALGISDKKLEIILAILQKHARLPLDRLDVYVNVAGGMTIREPAVDLAVCLAITSSVRGKILKDIVACGEVGLLGEIKPVTNLEKRKKEALKFGFKNLLSFESAQELAILIQKTV
jgi:DNA repair protein RadA/Sms